MLLLLFLNFVVTGDERTFTTTRLVRKVITKVSLFNTKTSIPKELIKTNILKSKLHLMLGQIALYAITLSCSTIVKKSQSLNELLIEIREHYCFCTTKLQYLDFPVFNKWKSKGFLSMHSCFFHREFLNNQGRYVSSWRKGRIWRGTKPIYRKSNSIFMDLKIHIGLPGSFSRDGQQNHLFPWNQKYPKP